MDGEGAMGDTERERLETAGDTGTGSPDEQDTEGSSMLTLELGRSVIDERQREATEAVRHAGRVHEARKRQANGRRSLRDRLFGR